LLLAGYPGRSWFDYLVDGMRVLVCGGRHFDDALTLGSWLGGIHKDHGITLLIEGGQTGADRMAREFAKWSGIPFKTVEADWDKYGKAAGPIRNQKMLDEEKPDLVIAFEGGPGTANMIAKARLANVRVLLAEKINGVH
jgi:hypothetical protein